MALAKSTLLKIMAGIDAEIQGEARPMSGINVGYLPQEPQLDETKDVRGNVEDGVSEAIKALKDLEQLYLDYAEPDADFDALAKKQAELEAVIEAWDAHNLEHSLDVAADAVRLPPGMLILALSLGVKSVVLHYVAFYYLGPICFYWMSPLTT